MKLKHLGLNRTARLVLHDVGLLLHVPGIMALLSLPICLWFGEYSAIKPFLETAIASFISGQQCWWVSTAGGLKLQRMVTLSQGLPWQLQQFFLKENNSIS